jgi:hypothetical protein
MVRVAPAVFCAVLVASCQTARIDAPFDPSAAAYVFEKGSGTIEGEAFLRRDSGTIMTAAGERVFLIPATAYAVARFETMFGGDRRAYAGAAVDDAPEAYLRYRREAKVDMKGKFVFENVAPGRYIVATRVFWTETKSYFPVAQGGAIYDIVEVEKDGTARAIISGV